MKTLPSVIVLSVTPPHEAYGTNTSSNMKKHLLTKHGIVIEKGLSKLQASIVQQLSELYAKVQASGQTDQLDNQVLRLHLNQEVIIEALISMIVVRNLPFRIVEWPEFHTFCQTLNKECKITTTHSCITRKIEESWISHKDIVRRELQSAVSHIHISLDIWTSPNQHLLLAVCGHFTTHLFKKQKALLALKRVPGHSGENQFAILLPVLQDYGIVRKLGGIVADNASTNDTLCQAIQRHMVHEEDLEWTAAQWRIRCTGHIINLAVQAFLFTDALEIEELESYDTQDQTREEVPNEDIRKTRFRLMGPLGQIHNIVAHIRSSPTRIQTFRNLASRLIPLDNRTRWNSWYLMLEIAIQHRDAIDKYTQLYDPELELDELNPQDWKQLRTIKEFLQPFYRATTYTEGDSVAINRTLFSMDILIKHFQNSLVSTFLVHS